MEENQSLKTCVSDLEYRVDDLEAKIAEQDLYVRRNNIEIPGIPNLVQQNELESHVIEALGKIKVDLEPSDVEACHRLSGESSPQSLDLSTGRSAPIP